VHEESKKEYRETIENIALQISFWCNVFLFFLKLSGAILTLSLSVISSAIDSFLDLFSGLILYFSNKLRKKKSNLDFYHFPVGKTRLEPLGFIIFASVMATAKLQIIKEAIYVIFNKLSDPKIAIEPQKFGFQLFAYYYGICVLLFTIFLKIFLCIMCMLMPWSQELKAYTIDHRNDIISNSFFGINVWGIKICMVVRSFRWNNYFNIYYSKLDFSIFRINQKINR